MYKLSLLDKNFNTLIKNVKEPSWMTQTRHESFKKYTSLPLESSALYSKYSNANKLIPDNIFFNSSISFKTYYIYNTLIQKLIILCYRTLL